MISSAIHLLFLLIIIINSTNCQFNNQFNHNLHDQFASSSSQSHSQVHSFLSSDDFARAQDDNIINEFDYLNDLAYDPETSNSHSGYYEGDMMIKQKEEEMVARYTAKRWPNGRIPYAMEKGKFSNEERAAIARGIMTLQDRTCIKFVPKQNHDKDYVMMKKGPGCAAHVGRIGGQQLLYLGRGCFGIETVVHELMHAVGFIHEQSRPDRDEHVEILWQNIKSEQKRNFRKHTTDYLADHGFPYDLMSAMHYRTHAFSKNNKPTIRAKRPVPYLRCRGHGCPSDLDVKKINYLYKCNGKVSGFKGAPGDFEKENEIYGHPNVMKEIIPSKSHHEGLMKGHAYDDYANSMYDDPFYHDSPVNDGEAIYDMGNIDHDLNQDLSDYQGNLFGNPFSNW